MSTQQQIVEKTRKYVIENYGRLPMAFARGAGAKIWDADGKEFIDFFAGFGGAGVAGHCHPAIVAALKHQAETLLCHGNLYMSGPQADLAEMITRHAFGGKVFYCHSGAEANEAALKLVRLAAGPGRYKIISFEKCFHGRTMGGLSLTPKDKQAGFEPMLPGNVMLPYNDLDAVANAIDAETAGIFVEPIQGEGGINMPSKAYMQGLRALCDKHKLLLVCDEVWTGPARTGRWFGYQYYDMAPDVMTVAKALGGGVPLAVCVAGPSCADVLTPGKHGCTMGGNPLCAAAGVATMKLIEDEDLVSRAAKKGADVMAAIRAANAPCVKSVRGAGFMIGIEIDKPAKEVFNACMAAGLLIGSAGASVLRLAPPLVIPDDLLAKGMDILIRALKQ
ncbi:MAG: acetylornithine/succinylornithine family transaminase [Planctomycetota bacterium]|nr:acetylornithine/succinylornithine family transaminase [Planctomycetota bacterium]